MKTITFVLLSVLYLSTARSQPKDTTAVAVIRANLDVVAGFLNKKDTSLKRISEAIYFLNDLTGISNEFYGKYYGQFKPTIKDHSAWTAWLEANKAYVQWDKETRSVMLFKRVVPQITE